MASTEKEPSKNTTPKRYKLWRWDQTNKVCICCLFNFYY